MFETCSIVDSEKHNECKYEKNNFAVTQHYKAVSVWKLKIIRLLMGRHKHWSKNRLNYSSEFHHVLVVYILLRECWEQRENAIHGSCQTPYMHI